MSDWWNDPHLPYDQAVRFITRVIDHAKRGPSRRSAMRTAYRAKTRRRNRRRK